MPKSLRSRWLAFLSVTVLATTIAVGCSAKTTPSATTATTPQPPETDYIRLFQPLGAMPIPSDNPITEQKNQLGQTLFFDKRLSGNNKSSCATCHNPNLGYADNRSTFTGFENTIGKRNSPTIINAGYYNANFLDGRAKNLEEQALGPIQAPGEMNQNLDELLTELRAVPWYVDQFRQVFGEEITAQNIAKAIAAYERTIVVNNSDFDRYLTGDKSALTPEATRGIGLFVNKGGCISCHSGPTLSDGNYYSIGVKSDDLGRYGVTKNEGDQGKFRTPALRALGYTAPYMHDGSIATLEEVVHFYNLGGSTGQNKDPRIRPLGLTADEESDLVAFLKSLNGTFTKNDFPVIP